MPETIWLWGGAAGCAAATASAVRSRRSRVTLLALVLAGACFAVAIALRWARLGHGPFLSPFEILLSNLFSLSVLYAAAWWTTPAIRAGAPVAAGFLLLTAAWCLVTPPDATQLPATYDNPWLWVHVLSGKLFLGAVLAAFGVALLRLLARRSRRLPADDLAEWRWMSVAFVCQTVMLVAGAAWARDAWGRFWAWDPLETWSLVNWVLLGAALHARLSFRLPAGVHAGAVVLVFVLAVLTFLGVPFISESVHKGVL